MEEFWNHHLIDLSDPGAFSSQYPPYTYLSSPPHFKSCVALPQSIFLALNACPLLTSKAEY